MDALPFQAGLTSTIVSAGDVDLQLRATMYDLFATYYDGTDPDVFCKELSEKDAVVLVWNGSVLCGFSTMQTFRYLHEGCEIAVLFSGDTILDRAYWGRQDLAAGWLRQVGRIARRHQGLPLYWLLIVKGHRTYRYMPTFAIKYVPDWRCAGGGASELLRLRDALARARFGDEFDAATGIIRFRSPNSRLKAELAIPTERERQRPDVAYFLARNPDYAAGDEFVCLCSLAPENMRPFGRRLYEQGAST